MKEPIIRRTYYAEEHYRGLKEACQPGQERRFERRSRMAVLVWVGLVLLLALCLMAYQCAHSNGSELGL